MNPSPPPQESITHWNLIESDPALFTQLIKEYGVKGLQVDELMTLDLKELENLEPIYGYVFLFKYQAKNYISNNPNLDLQDVPSDLFFANQVIPNACATLALLSIILNIDLSQENEVELGVNLESFKSFVNDFPPDLKGLSLTNSQPIQNAHNKFGGIENIIFDNSVQDNDNNNNNKQRDQDVFHYVSYIWFNNHIYELDGLNSCPIKLEKCNKENWAKLGLNIIKQRIKNLSNELQNELRFSVMCVVRNQIQKINNQINALKKDPQQNNIIQNQIIMLNHQLNDLRKKQQKDEDQNILRTHNHLPTIIELFKALAEEDKLDSIFNNKDL